MKTLFALIAIGSASLLSAQGCPSCPGGSNYQQGANYYRGGSQPAQGYYQQAQPQNYQQGAQQGDPDLLRQGYRRVNAPSNQQSAPQNSQQSYSQTNAQNYQTSSPQHSGQVDVRSNQQNTPYINPQSYQKDAQQDYSRQDDRDHLNDGQDSKANAQKSDHKLTSDEEISKHVHEALTGGWFSKGYQHVSYAVNNGVVDLSGTVESQDNKDTIDGTVKKLDGVREVNNHIKVVKPTAGATTSTKKYSDSQLQDSEKKYPRDSAANQEDRQVNAKIRDQLSGWFSKTNETILIRTANGIVIISGTVEKPEDIQKINDQVKNIEGVKSVNNQLQAKTK